MLLQIIHTVRMKGSTEAALIALSIFLLSTFFTFGVFFFLPNLCHLVILFGIIAIPLGKIIFSR
jgi:hypothetical protein